MVRTPRTMPARPSRASSTNRLRIRTSSGGSGRLDGLDESLALAARQEGAGRLVSPVGAVGLVGGVLEDPYRLARQPGDRSPLGQTHGGSIGEPAEDDQGCEVGSG